MAKQFSATCCTRWRMRGTCLLNSNFFVKSVHSHKRLNGCEAFLSDK